MKLEKLAGATSEIWQIWIADSSSAVGAGLTGLTNASGSLTAYYHRDTDTTATAIALVTMTVGTFTSSGFKEIDATNMPGWYQFCPPNAALAAGAKSCAFLLKGATNMAPLAIEVQLVAVNPDSATAFMTSVASVTGAVGSVTGAVGSVTAAVTISAGTGAGQLDFTSGIVKSNLTQILGTTLTETAGQIAAAFKQFFNIASPTSTMNTITTVTTATNLTNLPSIPANWLTAAGINAGALNGKGDWNIGKTGYALSSAGVQAIWDALTSALTTVGSIGKLLVDNINATISSRSTYAGGAVASVTGAVGSVTADVGITQAGADKVWDTAIAGHLGAGSTGLALNSAGAAGDPWSTAIPGAYGAGTAGKILGTNLDATVSSRSTFAGGAVASVTANVNADVKKINGTTVNGNGSAGTPWGP
jgi:hypothetical protein